MIISVPYRPRPLSVVNDVISCQIIVVAEKFCLKLLDPIEQNELNGVEVAFIVVVLHLNEFNWLRRLRNE